MPRFPQIHFGVAVRSHTGSCTLRCGTNFRERRRPHGLAGANPRFAVGRWGVKRSHRACCARWVHSPQRAGGSPELNLKVAFCLLFPLSWRGSVEDAGGVRSVRHAARAPLPRARGGLERGLGARSSHGMATKGPGQLAALLMYCAPDAPGGSFASGLVAQGNA